MKEDKIPEPIWFPICPLMPFKRHSGCHILPFAGISAHIPSVDDHPSHRDTVLSVNSYLNAVETGPHCASTG